MRGDGGARLLTEKVRGGSRWVEMYNAALQGGSTNKRQFESDHEDIIIIDLDPEGRPVNDLQIPKSQHFKTMLEKFEPGRPGPIPFHNSFAYMSSGELTVIVFNDHDQGSSNTYRSGGPGSIVSVLVGNGPGVERKVFPTETSEPSLVPLASGQVGPGDLLLVARRPAKFRTGTISLSQDR
jgi:hypothetical protein